VLIDAPELHLPLNRPVKVVQRSLDVLHDFYVPQIRVKMDMVPGLVSSFWFTPTKAGRFEVLCAEYCGLAHSNMRAHIVVEPEDKFNAWLAQQRTFAGGPKLAAAGGAAAAGGDLAEQGRQIAQSRGCVACHSVDGKPGLGPTWKNLFGKTETLTGGATVKVDDAYLKRSISEPNAQVVQGFQPVMPKVGLSDQEMDAVIAYIKQAK